MRSLMRKETTAQAANRPLPELYNLVILIACGTLGQGYSQDNAAIPFGIRNAAPGPLSVNKALVGFMDCLAGKENAEALPQWTAQLLDRMKQGWTIGQAVHEINLLPSSGGVIVTGTGGGRVWAGRVGDPNMKLMGVYGGTGGVNQWYLVY
jgi:hypothetical protein